MAARPGYATTSLLFGLTAVGLGSCGVLLPAPTSEATDELLAAGQVNGPIDGIDLPGVAACDGRMLMNPVDRHGCGDRQAAAVIDGVDHARVSAHLSGKTSHEAR